jgi:hypothetical protein
MQGTPFSLHVTFNNNKYTNPTVPAFVASLTAHTPPASRLTKWIDAPGVLSPNGTQVRLAIVNRHQTRAYSVPKGAGKVVAHQVCESFMTILDYTILYFGLETIVELSSVLTAVSVHRCRVRICAIGMRLRKGRR